MPQFLKKEIKENILDAAVQCFVQKGYRATTMAAIGEAAGISTGNIYRYFANKDVLFRAVLTEQFVKQFTELLYQRVKALDGITDLNQLDPGASYYLISEELFQFCLQNRLRVVILLSRAQGTAYESFASQLVHNLVCWALEYAKTLQPTLRVTQAMMLTLEHVYRALVQVMVASLLHDEESVIREAVETYSKYHLAGLKGLFAR